MADSALRVALGADDLKILTPRQKRAVNGRRSNLLSAGQGAMSRTYPIVCSQSAAIAMPKREWS